MGFKEKVLNRGKNNAKAIGLFRKAHHAANLPLSNLRDGETGPLPEGQSLIFR